MAKTSGGLRGSGSQAPRNFEASVSVINKRDEYRWLTKSFRTQKQAEQWIDKVANRFDSPSKSGFAAEASINKMTKKGMDYGIFTRDLGREFEARERRRSRGGIRY